MAIHCNDAPDWASLNSFQALPDFGRLVHASVFSTARTWVLLQAMTNVGSMQIIQTRAKFWFKVFHKVQTTI